jgi:hypothetical protein
MNPDEFAALLAKKATLESILERIDVWLLVFGAIVVIGVAGESVFGIRHWWNSRKLQTLQHTEDQERQAEIGRVAKDLAEARTKQAEAERQLEEIRTQQGPHWRLLEEAAPKLIEQLKAFRGQSALIVPCGPSNRIDSELTRVIGALGDI